MSKSFKKDLIEGVFYTGIGKYSSIFISLIVTAILARLLTPDDFGVVAIATIVITFFNMISEIGIAPAIIQYKNLTVKDTNNIFSLTVYIAIISTSVFIIGVPYIVHIYANDALTDILQYLSISLFFAILNIVPNALFYKEKKFKLISIRTFFIQLSVGIISIIAALSGFGIYSLLIAPILSNFILFIVGVYFYPQKFTYKIEKEAINKIFSFSMYQFLFNIINYFTRNLDKLLIGKYIGMTALGFYEKSYRLMMLPLSNISSVLNPVLHPILSDFQFDKTEMEEKYTKIIQLLSYIGIFLTIIMFFGSKEIILIIFGEQWLEAVDVFQILSLSIVIQLLMSPCGAVFQATNSTKQMFIFAVISILTTILGFIISIICWKSAIAVAYSFDITLFINFIIGYNILYRKVLVKRYQLFLNKLKKSFILFSGLFILFFLLKQIIVIENIFLSLIFIVTFTFIIELTYIHLLKIYNVRSLVRKYLHF